MERYLIHWNLASVRINSLFVLYWALSRFFSTSKLTGLHTPGCGGGGGGGMGAFRRQTKVGKLNSCWKTHVACENDATTVSKHVGELLPRIKTSFFLSSTVCQLLTCYVIHTRKLQLTNSSLPKVCFVKDTLKMSWAREAPT